jgi:uncharacterized membrane protein YkvA (DUF1232 family)
VSRQAWIVLGVVLAIVAIVTLVVAVRLVVRLFAVRRMLGELGASGKVVFWGAIAYTIFPIDLLPDPIYLDDIGVLGAALLFLTRQLHKRGAFDRVRPPDRQSVDAPRDPGGPPRR